ncbi:hypothetical protein R3X27_10100 [Tropicimonas sp. TH_r6]|uniref:hypothetical protein n=1 Tax=Tropicimonas sp. TH_r6 TaxID=3082085 RepID=UPI002955CD24|nr:hypothetical protein [Tropicimonas sp. TH_r6]MDV7143036.1 hypothetical protein [Tropicimonas sp. TH_r6]
MRHPFETKSQRAINQYIAGAKALPIFAPDVPDAIDWPQLTWNVTALVKRARESSNETIPFHHARSRTPTSNDAMAEPFGDVVKAFIAYELDENSRKPWKSRKTNVYTEYARPIRYLDVVLRDRGKPGRVDRIAKEDLTAALEHAGKTQKQAAAQALRKFARQLDNAGITKDLDSWHHPALLERSHSRANRSRVNPKKSRKKISKAEVSCLARAYRSAVSDKDRFAMSIVALLMCTPSRKEEPFLLPAQAEIVKNPGADRSDEDIPFHLRSTYKCGLRWWPLKGGPAQVKFVPKEMMPVAVEALETIRELTREARNLASWMMENPGQIRLPSGLEHVPEARLITISELSQMLLGPRSWLSKRGIKAKVRRNTKEGFGAPNLYSWDEVQQAMLKETPRGWPVLSRVSEVKYSDALCVSFLNQFDERNATRSWMVKPIDTGIIDDVLSGQPEGVRENGKIRPAVPSIFERMAIRLPDGSIPKITTHQIRHYLNTIAQRARVPQAHIAHWSGRRHVMENEDYDHTDMLFEVEQILRGEESQELPAIAGIVDDSDFETLDYLRGDRKMQLHSTAYGYCNRRFMEEPCDRAGACRTCTRLVCLGGSKRAADQLLREAARDERSLENLRSRQLEGRTVNQKTVEAVEQSSARSRAMAEAIMDPKNSGLVIRNCEFGPLLDFSHAGRIIEKKRKEIVSEDRPAGELQ